MSDLSAADIAEGRRLDKAATPRKWWGCGTHDIFTGNGLADSQLVAAEASHADAELIVWARNHLPALLDAAEKVTAIQALHTPDEGHSPRCRCGATAHAGRRCIECSTPWPCATIRAINPEETDSGE